MKQFDLIVIGAGPGGLEAAVLARHYGLNTALIDKSHIGGTCLNVGCIPTKALLASMQLFGQMRRCADYGISASKPAISMNSMLERKNKIVEKLRSAAAQSVQKSGVVLIQGEATFKGPHQISVSGDVLEAKHIIIATGSSPASIPGTEIDHKTVLSSDDILNLNEIPKSILILGGGAIGVEFASYFNSLGSQVTIVEMLAQLLPKEDPDIAKRLEALFQRKGIQVQTGTKWDGQKSAEKILMAVGRRPNTAALNLSAAGIQTEKNGTIKVNEYLETSQKGVYALGDVLDSPQLAHAASYEAEVVLHHIDGKKKQARDYSAIPNCVYSSPEIASVGITKADAEAKGIEFAESKIPFSAIAKCHVEGETDGFLKLIAAKNGTLIGGAAIGAHVTELIPEIALAVRLKLHVRELAHTVHAHPTMAEAIQLAARELSCKVPFPKVPGSNS